MERTDENVSKFKKIMRNSSNEKVLKILGLLDHDDELDGSRDLV